MSLPSSYSAILSDLNREVLRAQPEDPLQFCANWFASRLEHERTQARSGSSSHSGKYLVPSPSKNHSSVSCLTKFVTRQRQLSVLSLRLPHQALRNLNPAIFLSTKVIHSADNLARHKTMTSLPPLPNTLQPLSSQTLPSPVRTVERSPHLDT